MARWDTTQELQTLTEQTQLVKAQERALLATWLFVGVTIFGAMMLVANVTLGAAISVPLATALVVIGSIKTAGAYSMERAFDRRVKAHRADMPEWYGQLSHTFDKVA